MFKPMIEEEILEQCVKITRASHILLKVRMTLRSHLSSEMKFRLEELEKTLPLWQEE